jgi:hypothetical protein
MDGSLAERTSGLPFRSFTVAGAFLHAGYRVLFFDQEHDLDRERARVRIGRRT